MNFQAAAEGGTARAQRDINVASGEVWQRGTELVLVEEVRSSRIYYINDRGQQYAALSGDFRARALTRLGDVSGLTVNYLDGAWGIASAKGIPADIRVIALSLVSRRAPDNESRLTVLRWSASLSRGSEPRRRG